MRSLEKRLKALEEQASPKEELIVVIHRLTEDSGNPGGQLLGYSFGFRDETAKDPLAERGALLGMGNAPVERIMRVRGESDDALQERAIARYREKNPPQQGVIVVVPLGEIRTA